MFDSDGKQTWNVDYDIYGKKRKQDIGNAIDCPFRYQGQYEDEETGLYYNRFRYYSAEEGIFISQDPIGIAGSNPTFYAYTKDNNIYIDVFGLDIISEAWKVAANNINNSGTTVLGHFPRPGETFESYIDKAIRKNGSYFSIGDMWNDVSKTTDPWVLNEKFLDVVAAKGDKILLNVPKNEIRPGSYLEKEIKHLTEKKGYVWQNQWSLVKKCK